MNGVWSVISINTYSYDATEVKTNMCITKEEAEEAFYKLCKAYLDSERQYYMEKLFLNNEVSYSDIREIAMEEEEEALDYGYEDSGNEKIFTIRKNYDDGDAQEELIVRMFYSEFGKEQDTQFYSFNDDSDSVNEFFKFLNTLTL